MMVLLPNTLRRYRTTLRVKVKNLTQILSQTVSKLIDIQTCSTESFENLWHPLAFYFIGGSVIDRGHI